MTDIDRAAEIIAESITRDSAPAHEIVSDLEHDGLLMPDPKIIRNLQELEALDHYTMVLTDSRYTAWYAAQIEEWELPAVVIRDGAEVRAARAALEEA